MTTAVLNEAQNLLHGLPHDVTVQYSTDSCRGITVSHLSSIYRYLSCAISRVRLTGLTDGDAYATELKNVELDNDYAVIQTLRPSGPLMFPMHSKSAPSLPISTLTVALLSRCFSGTLTRLSTFGTTTHDTSTTIERRYRRARVLLTRCYSSRRRTRRNCPLCADGSP